MTRSRVDVSRPPVTKLRNSATKRTIHRSPNSMAAVNATGESSGISTGDTKTPKPATVSMRPIALSGRWRQAMRPHAANETPESVRTTSYPRRGGARSNNTGIRAANPAAAAATHSASQNHGLCVGAVNPRSPWTRPRATGRATSSRTPTSQGIKRIIGLSRR